MRWMFLGLLSGVLGVAAAMGNLMIGGQVLDRAALERRQQSGTALTTLVIGGIVIRKDVPPELAAATIRRLYVIGGITMPKALQEALSRRIVVLAGGIALR